MRAHSIALLFCPLLLLCGCKSTGPKAAPPDRAPSLTAMKLQSGYQTMFERDGHQFTTFMVARMAGWEPAEAYALTYYCQYPDDEKRYNATASSIKYLLVPWKWRWRGDLNKFLHSLHGGDNQSVQDRRRALEKLVNTTLAQPGDDRLWQAGLMIHAFGDSFAHTMGDYGSGKESAYGSLYGHGFRGHYPDQIANPDVFPKYAAYVRALYRALDRGQNKHLEQAVEHYLAGLKPFVCASPGECDAARRLAMAQEIERLSKQVPGFSSRAYLMFCNSAPSLNPRQVQEVMDQIKEAKP